MDHLPRLGKRELVCLLLFTCNYVVSVWRGFLFLWVLGMGYVILLWHSLGIPYNYFGTLLCMFGWQKCALNCFVTFKIVENLFYVSNARLIMGRIIC